MSRLRLWSVNPEATLFSLPFDVQLQSDMKQRWPTWWRIRDPAISQDADRLKLLQLSKSERTALGKGGTSLWWLLSSSQLLKNLLQEQLIYFILLSELPVWVIFIWRNWSCLAWLSCSHDDSIDWSFSMTSLKGLTKRCLDLRRSGGVIIWVMRATGIICKIWIKKIIRDEKKQFACFFNIPFMSSTWSVKPDAVSQSSFSTEFPRKYVWPSVVKTSLYVSDAC